jgi:hypothetical protein
MGSLNKRNVHTWDPITEEEYNIDKLINAHNRASLLILFKSSLHLKVFELGVKPEHEGVRFQGTERSRSMLWLNKSQILLNTNKRGSGSGESCSINIKYYDMIV